jgi:hypothetical protein
LQRKNMMAANYRHIGGRENRLGRHYSRFSASGPAAPLAAQSLARRKSPNHGSNRRSQANIGAADGELSLQSASDDLRELTEAELVRAGQAPDVVAPQTLVPSGETRDIHRAGGRYVTLVGSNPLFHLPQDRWPHAVDTDTVTRIAEAAAALVVKLTR